MVHCGLMKQQQTITCTNYTKVYSQLTNTFKDICLHLSLTNTPFEDGGDDEFIKKLFFSMNPR